MCKVNSWITSGEKLEGLILGDSHKIRVLLELGTWLLFRKNEDEGALFEIKQLASSMSSTISKPLSRNSSKNPCHGESGLSRSALSDECSLMKILIGT